MVLHCLVSNLYSVSYENVTYCVTEFPSETEKVLMALWYFCVVG